MNLFMFQKTQFASLWEKHLDMLKANVKISKAVGASLQKKLELGKQIMSTWPKTYATADTEVHQNFI